MRYVVGIARKPHRILFVLVLVSLCSAWTCTAVVNLDNCRAATPYPQIGALSPNPISADTVSALLTVEGTGFVPQSEILWDKNPLPTAFVDSLTCKRRLRSRHLIRSVDKQGRMC